MEREVLVLVHAQVANAVLTQDVLHARDVVLRVHRPEGVNPRSASPKTATKAQQSYFGGSWVVPQLGLVLFCFLLSPFFFVGGGGGWGKGGLITLNFDGFCRVIWALRTIAL